MNNRAFDQLAKEFLKGQNSSKLNNILNSNDGRTLANKLNQMSQTNPALQSVVNSAKKGDINSAKTALQGMMNTQEGQDLAKTISKILGE